MITLPPPSDPAQYDRYCYLGKDMVAFTSHGRRYSIDRFGVVHQTDAKPFKYDETYVAIYDTPAYKQRDEVLQALRWGFVQAAHGRRINSLLDYGYGSGAFIRFVQHQLAHPYGYDLTGVHVEGAYIVPEVVKADVITFWDALEHVPDLSFLVNLPCETVVISLPYCHLITHGTEWFDGWHHRKPDEHLHHFNEFSLANLMAACGWRRVVAVSGHEDIVRTRRDPKLQNILTMAFKR